MNKSRILALAALCLLSSSLSTGALADATSEALVRAFIERIDKDSEWQAAVANVSSQGDATLVDGLKVSREDGTVTVTVPKLTLDSLALREGGGINLAAFSSETIEMKGASWTFTGSGFSGKGLKTPSFEGWTFDPKTPVTSLARFYTRLAKTEFAEIVLPAGIFETEVPTPGATDKTKSKAVYTNMRLDNLSNGILSSQSIGRMESATQAGTAPAIATVFDSFKANGLNLSAVARVLDPDSYANGKGDGQWLSAMESAGYGRISVKQGDKENATIASLTSGRFEVRQPPEPFAAAIDELIAKGSDPPDAEVFAFLDKHLSNLTGWFRIESMEMKDLAASPPEGGDVKVASIGVQNVSPDGMKSFAIKDFTINSPQFNGKLGLFEVADVVWPSLRAFILFGKLEETKKTGDVPDAALVDEISAKFLNLIPRFGRMEIRDVSAGMPGSEPLTLKNYISTNAGGMALLPKEADVKLDSLIIPRGILRATPESADVFDQLGYNELILHADGKATHDEQSGAYSTGINFTAEDAGSLKLAYGLGGLTLDNIRAFIKPLVQSKDGNPDQAAMMTAITPLSVADFKLRYEDASLVKRLLPYVAKMQGTDEATLIGNTTAMLQLGLSQLKNPAFTQQVVESIGAFLKNPQSLTLSLKPSQPVQVLQLMQIDPNNPGTAIDLLGVTMTAND